MGIKFRFLPIAIVVLALMLTVKAGELWDGASEVRAQQTPGERPADLLDDEEPDPEDEESEAEEVERWDNVSPRVLVRFFDALRNEDSANHNLWLGYFYTLIEHDAAEIYFDYAKLKDSSPAMAEAIRKITEE